MIFVLVIGAAMAALTWLVGWWGVALLAAIVGYVHFREGGGGWRVALAAAGAWGVLLVIDVVSGPFATVTRTIGGVLRVPGPVLILLTLAFAALLAWSAATFVAGLRQLAAVRAGP
jgi:hypothetical protein